VIFSTKISFFVNNNSFQISRRLKEYFFNILSLKEVIIQRQTFQQGREKRGVMPLLLNNTYIKQDSTVVLFSSMEIGMLNGFRSIIEDIRANGIAVGLNYASNSSGVSKGSNLG